MPGRRPRDDDHGRSLDYAFVGVPEPPGSAAGHPKAGRSVSGEVLATAEELSWRERLWLTMHARTRRLVAAGTGLAVAVPACLVAVVVQGGDWLAERERRERIHLGLSLGVWTSSNSPGGGYVKYYVSVRNAGSEPLEVTALKATGAGLQLRSLANAGRRVASGQEISVPLSALLTCSPEPAGDPAAPLLVEITVRRDDGRLSPQHPPLDDAALVLDVVDTLCSVRPDLRDYELSGPVIKPPGDA